MSPSKELILEGKILSKGIAFGSAVFLDTDNFFEHNSISKNDLFDEIQKFKNALLQSKKQILNLKKSLAKDKLSITFDILNTHLEILNDPIILKEVVNRIKNEKKSIEVVFHDIILDYKNKIKDPFFQEKSLDIADVFKRILTNIRSVKIDVVKNFDSKSIVLSNEIIPSDVFEIENNKICGFVSFSGSYESHAAIIARSKNIPFLTKINIEKLKHFHFSQMIVDANSGRLILNPSKQTYEKYENLKKLLSDTQNVEKVKIKKDCNLFVNISNKTEVNSLVNKNICGVGLLRTELYFLGNKELPKEEDQFIAYKEIAEKLKNLPLIIRLFDLGADKLFYHLANNAPCNFFESRGVDYLLKNKQILINQIRAILRASFFGNIYILIPFVKDLKEILLVKKCIFEEQRKMKLDFSNIKIGSMIETPAAALTIDEILKNVDFISIGTNDLTRYTTASNDLNSDDLHKSLIRLIEMIVKTSKSNNKPTFVCGELTANKKILSKLINLGISNFSLGLKHLQNFEKIS